MARPVTSDFLQNFRFHVSVMEGFDGISFSGSGSPHVSGEAGFQSASLPDISIEAAEYREGTFKYTKKFPGPPTISDVSLMRGVVAADTAFFDWAISTISGGAYRCDIKILQYQRGDLPTPSNPAENASIPAEAARIYKCFECVPTRAKPAGDLDATSGEVAMAECDFALEYFTVENPPPAAE
jgi:phage tail-like protein